MSKLESVTIEIKLHGVLRRYRPDTAPGLPHRPFSYHIPLNTSISGLVTQLGIPDGLVTGIGLNGQTSNETTILQPGDKVSLFPPAAGGSLTENINLTLTQLPIRIAFKEIDTPQ